MPPCNYVIADVISTNDGTFYSHQEALPSEVTESASESDQKFDHTSPISGCNLETIETLSNTTEFSAVSIAEVYKPPQLIYGNESGTIEEKSETSRSTTKIDHVYEEVSTIKEPHLFEYDILDYYEKYSPTTAKTLIYTLFLPRYKICKQCASSQDSPVYTDSLIYSRKPIYAKEIGLHFQNDALQFKYLPEEGEPSSTTLFSQYDNIQPCMLVYNYSKTSASSIFYFHGPPRDTFDLKALLKPDILLLSSSNSSKEVVNTELYHRCATNFYNRISNHGNAPMTFQVNHENILSSIKHVGYDTDLQNWMNYRNDVFRTRSLKQDDVTDHRANRSSLLLLEPLLLMPDLTSPRYRHGKNRMSQSEHMKIVKIVIAYTLSFFILAIITFYIVYFT